METRITHDVANLLESCIDNKSHLFGKILHAYIFRIGLSTDTFLSNRLIELYFKCKNNDYAHHLFHMLPQKNIYSWNAILTESCKAGNVGAARKLFAQMPERTAVSWNNLISSLVHGGLERQALDVCDEMIHEGFIPTHFTLASVLSACATLLDAKFGRRCHGLTVKIGLEKNLYVSNALLSVYAKCRLVRDAIRLFKEMDKPSEVTYTAMINGFRQTDRIFEALEVFKLMRRQGIHGDSVSLSSVLGVCSRGGSGESSMYEENNGDFCYTLGKLVHGLAVKLGFENNLHLSNTLLDMYAKNGDMDSAECVFVNLPEVSVVSWNVMIAGYGQKCRSEKAIEYVQKIESRGFEPDEVTYINMLAACVKSGDMDLGRQMFDHMACPSVSSWNAILSGYFEIGDHKEAMKLFREMQFRFVKPDRTTLAIVLSLCARTELLEAGKQVHSASLKAALCNDVYVASGLIGMYSNCNKMDTAECIFEKLPELDIVCWNSMISGFSLNSSEKKALTFFQDMQKNGLFPTQFSYTTILSCCAKLSSLFQGQQVHGLIVKEGFVNDVYVGSALIDMYCKCGEVDLARKFFDMMPVKSTTTWNEMIHGYAQNGRGFEAVNLYKSMIDNFEKPDEITFVAVLTGCSHSGLIDTGIEIFNSMARDHGVEPVLDHYTCIIYGLARAGRFNEVVVLIDKIPYEDDPIFQSPLPDPVRKILEEGISLYKLHTSRHGRLESTKGSYAKEWSNWEKRLREVLFGNSQYLNSIQVPFESAVQQVLEQLKTIAKGEYTTPLTHKRKLGTIVFAAVSLPVEDISHLLNNMAQTNPKVEAFLRDKNMEHNLKKAHVTLAHKRSHCVAAVASYGIFLHQKVPVECTALLFTDKIAAQETEVVGSVDGEKVVSKNTWPHVTIWTGEGVAAKEANAAVILRGESYPC